MTSLHMLSAINVVTNGDYMMITILSYKQRYLRGYLMTIVIMDHHQKSTNIYLNLTSHGKQRRGDKQTSLALCAVT